MWLQEKGINLTHIESRPSRTNTDQYEFFINVDTSCSQALDEVIDSLRTEISGHVHELSRNKEKDTGHLAGLKYICIKNQTEVLGQSAYHTHPKEFLEV